MADESIKAAAAEFAEAHDLRERGWSLQQFSNELATFARQECDRETADLRDRLAAYKWRPIKSADDLPKNPGSYWMQNIQGEVFIDCYDPLELNLRRFYLTQRVAWMPIPKPEPFKELQESK